MPLPAIGHQSCRTATVSCSCLEVEINPSDSLAPGIAEDLSGTYFGEASARYEKRAQMLRCGDLH
jgi:hypothetical protein